MGDITPPLGVTTGSSLATSKVTHIHDPLHVRAIVLDDGARRLAFVVCDNKSIPQEVCDGAKLRTQKLTGLDPQQIVISATHTHSTASASSPAGYRELFVQRIADTVQCAINRLEPARIGWGRGEEPAQVFNRRWFMRSRRKGGTAQTPPGRRRRRTEAPARPSPVLMAMAPRPIPAPPAQPTPTIRRSSSARSRSIRPEIPDTKPRTRWLAAGSTPP